MSGSRPNDAENGEDSPDASAAGGGREADADADVDADTDSDGREWRFALDEVGEDAEPRGPPEPEPGSPSAENVLFVVLGMAATLAVVAIVIF